MGAGFELMEDPVAVAITNAEMESWFADLSTPLVADACIRLGLPVRAAPTGIQPLDPRRPVAGRVRPVHHLGSVDAFLEALEAADPGEILVIDNDGRTDEACIGDLVVLELQAAKLGGVVVWGLHRDTEELQEIAFPVFSYGALAAGPPSVREETESTTDTVQFGDEIISAADVVFADLDGVIFVTAEQVAEVLDAAAEIATHERDQAALVRQGTTLREQLRFEAYLERRAIDPAHTFRRHLEEIGGAIEA